MKAFGHGPTSDAGTDDSCRSGSVPKGRFCPFEQGRVVRDSSFLDDAVLYVVGNYDPIRVYIYGPAAAGFVDHYKTFEMIVIVDESLDSEKFELEKEIRRRLIDEFHINGHIMVMPESEFDDLSKTGGSEADHALKSGYVAYEA